MHTPLTIVLVEDHDVLREVTADVLRQAGHRVIALGCAEDMGDAVGGDVVDLFLLDLNLPGEDGISLARRLRHAHPTVGIIMVTARAAAQQMSEGFNCGADIYLIKPQGPDTLLAAVDSLAKRLKSVAPAEGVQLNSRYLTLRGPLGEVALQEMEAKLLTAFVRAPGQRLESWQLAELIGGNEEGASKSAIEVRITRLRKKLHDCGASDGAIKSLRTVGYQLCKTITVT